MCVVSQCFLVGNKVMKHRFPETSKRIASHPASKKIAAASRRVLERHFPPKKISTDEATVELNGINRFADRHIRRFLQIANDPDCKNPEIDLSLDDPAEADRIFNNCKLLIIRNAYSKKFLGEVRNNFTSFMKGLKSGRISTQGTTTTGDEYFYLSRGQGRWEIILPENLAHPDLVADEKILNILNQPHVLGDDIELRSLQSTNAEGGVGVGQTWHYDQQFLFGEGLNDFGIAGHDLPTYSVVIGIPMMDMQREHGPTEFCVGSSAVSGIPDNPLVKDKNLIAEGSLWQQYVQHGENSCPPQLWRSPLLNFGDVVLFDYNIRHRGGWNDSQNMRSILLAIYSRTWFDDINFGNIRRVSYHEEDQKAADVLFRSRLSRPEYMQVEDTTDEEENVQLKDIKDFNPADSRPAPFEINHEQVEFIASNFNVKGIDGSDVILHVNENVVGPFPPGYSRSILGTTGDTFVLKSRDITLGKWIAKSSGQVVFTKDAMVY
eukprot:CAMPEP_0178913886 /NCGR_PEP_ID=MMETSP0786-20121207/11098_1 /TAXON_ID=186022 /ORGANISM="Thalassionema frauenfeldii, Strain CCMP 1798" /LENGTH=491 /DNA_ID=CAMNT_0020586691 /DNA_START=1194 /DNA_END=2672 /DNA_ORIENTATION=+